MSSEARSEANSQTSPAVALRGVTVQERRRTVLDAIDLEVASSQTCAIVGSNGSGKSTLLRVVAALCRPSLGSVQVAGWDALRHPEQVRRNIGYVAGETGLADRLTPQEHLELVSCQHGLGRADRCVAAESMLELVDLTSQAHVYVGELSPGQRRRLAVALALVHDPPVILLDEPFAQIDEQGRSELTSVLLELRAMEKTLLVASQTQADVAEVADVLMLLAGGTLRALTRPEMTTLTWIETLGDSEHTFRTLREYPKVTEIHQDGNFFTFSGLSTPEDRSQIAQWLLSQGVRLAGFGATTTPAGGDRA
jgi:ABC-type multidrug transport system ATPase subunit